MSAHLFQCDTKTFLIAVHTTWDVQTLYSKTGGKTWALKSESRKSEWPNTLIHRLDPQDTEPAYKPGEFEVSCTNLICLQKGG